MQNELSPDYLCSLVPPTVGSTSSYTLRNANDLQIIHANSQLYYNSFLPSAVREWNELPEQKRNSSSLNIFKTRINSNINLPPSYYFTGKIIGQIYHARLRTKSALFANTCFLKILQTAQDAHAVLWNLRRVLLNTVSEKCKKGKRKVQGVPQSQKTTLPRPQEEEETDKSKQAQTEQTYEKH